MGFIEVTVLLPKAGAKGKSFNDMLMSQSCALPLVIYVLKMLFVMALSKQALLICYQAG